MLVDGISSVAKPPVTLVTLLLLPLTDEGPTLILESPDICRPLKCWVIRSSVISCFGGLYAREILKLNKCFHSKVHITYRTDSCCSDFRLCCHLPQSTEFPGWPKGFALKLPLQLPKPNSIIPPGCGALKGNDFRLDWGFISTPMHHRTRCEWACATVMQIIVVYKLKIAESSATCFLLLQSCHQRCVRECAKNDQRATGI